jgi:hypothetical protein
MAASLLKQVEIVLTYDGCQDQNTFIITAEDDVNEAAFVASCFGPADETETLIEISCRVIGAIRKGKKLTRAEQAALTLPEYLMKRNGKYYFDPDETKNADTQYWTRFRGEYVRLWREYFSKKKATSGEQAVFKRWFFEQWTAKGGPGPA